MSTILFLRFLLGLRFDREDISNTQACLNTFPNTSKFVKNTPLHTEFSTLFLVFRNVVKHGL